MEYHRRKFAGWSGLVGGIAAVMVYAGTPNSDPGVGLVLLFVGAFVGQLIGYYTHLILTIILSIGFVMAGNYIRGELVRGAVEAVVTAATEPAPVAPSIEPTPVTYTAPSSVSTAVNARGICLINETGAEKVYFFWQQISPELQREFSSWQTLFFYGDTVSEEPIHIKLDADYAEGLQWQDWALESSAGFVQKSGADYNANCDAFRKYYLRASGGRLEIYR